tara:strand:- start:117 stop:944 length:828 start_codon:yes stop_codon:yes gene_type:complete
MIKNLEIKLPQLDAYSHQTLVSHEHKFLYQPIPKCACRTIKTWMILLHKNFVELETILSKYGNDIPTGLMYDKFNDELKKSKINVHSLSKNIFPTFNSTENTDGYFKFAFVRNPYLRVAAAYQEKFKHPVHGLYYPNAKMLNDYVKQETDNDKDYFDKDGIIPFEVFVNILYTNAKDNNYAMFDVHWLPQNFFIERYLSGECDFIGKIEDMEESFKNLIKEINVNFYPEFKIGGTKNLEFYSSMYKDSETVDMVTEIYKQDIDRFNYSFLDWEDK